MGKQRTVTNLVSLPARHKALHFCCSQTHSSDIYQAKYACKDNGQTLLLPQGKALADRPHSHLPGPLATTQFDIVQRAEA